MDHKTVREKIHVVGRVQGIGFRPHIYRLAVSYGLSGYVRNSGGAAEILAIGSTSAVDAFVSAVADTAKTIPLARIDQIIRTLEDVPDDQPESSFFIEQSDETQKEGEILPDIAICPECEAELMMDGRRHTHYFNNCTVCGPRFTVARRLPYDRRNTSMDRFALCDACAKEYENPKDRRFHAETICCDDCGPVLRYLSKGTARTGDEAFSSCVRDLSGGGIVLIKGVGGYHLAASPYYGETIHRLREIKGRETKPFAVMFAGLSEVQNLCRVSTEEESLLTSREKPIVLLRLCEQDSPFAEDVLRGNRRCGSFLPYTALHVLLLRHFSAIVLTSANVSGRPILFEDGDALAFYAQHENEISGILYHDREIVRPAEDSVAAINCGKPQLLRIGRGCAPLSIQRVSEAASQRRQAQEIFAVGGDLKASFCFSRGNKVYGSAYYGDLEGADVFERFQSGVFDLEKILSVQPSVVACDMHPRYFSASFAHDFASDRALSCLTVQHHHAHIASVMAEHEIYERVVGVAFDGTGYGEDGNIWGGEFLCCEADGTYRLMAQLVKTRMIGGDDAARDAEKTAACYLLGFGAEVPENLAVDVPLIQAALHSEMGFLTSSMGRLFDAVSVLLGLCQANTYEGECAIALQQAAEACLDVGEGGLPLRFEISGRDGIRCIDFKDILLAAAVCPKDKAPEFALGFHEAIAHMVADVCLRILEKENTKKVALSGGVFQNTLLTDLCMKALNQKDLEVYINRRVPPNDGGIALGQTYVAAAIYKFCDLKR